VSISPVLDSSSDGFTVKAPPQPDHGGEP